MGINDVVQEAGLFKIHKDMNRAYVRFYNWAYQRDPPYWEKLMGEWHAYQRHDKKPVAYEQLELDLR
jgi:hypothetical protein